MTILSAARFALLGALLLAGPVSAQAVRTWVSGVGDDANPCSRTAPCKTFAGAISKTAPGGIIDVLDPGGYGAVTITKAITIDGNGHVASILNAGTNGVLVNAGTGNVVVIRNLAINGAGTGTNGIRFLSGAALHLQNVTIQGANVGISFEPSGASELTMTGGLVTRTTRGVVLKPGAAGTAIATFDRVAIVGNGGGLRVEARAMATVQDAVISDNDAAGIGAVSSTDVAQVTVRDSLLSGNNADGDPASAAAKASGTAATINLHDTAVVDNGNGLKAANGGTIRSSGRNRVAGNGDDGLPTTTRATL